MKKRLFACFSAAVMGVCWCSVPANAYEPPAPTEPFDAAFQAYLEQNGLHHYEGLGVLKDEFRGEPFYSDKYEVLEFVNKPYATAVLRTDIYEGKVIDEVWKLLESHFADAETEIVRNPQTGSVFFKADGISYCVYNESNHDIMIKNYELSTAFSDEIIGKLLAEELIAGYRAWEFSADEWSLATVGCLYYNAAAEDAVRPYLESHHPDYDIYHIDANSYGFFVAPAGVAEWSGYTVQGTGTYGNIIPDIRLTNEQQLMLWEEMRQDIGIFPDLNYYILNEKSGAKFAASDYIPALIRGDLDIDGSVDVTDAVKMLRVLNEDTNVKITDEGMDNADFDCDGDLTMKDFRSLMRYLAGLPY